MGAFRNTPKRRGAVSGRIATISNPTPNRHDRRQPPNAATHRARSAASSRPSAVSTAARVSGSSPP